MSAVPITLALATGGLATINPCGFSLLPAMLSFQVGAREVNLPPTRSRVGQGLRAGATVSAGFLLVFIALALPVSVGARLVSDAVPWVGAGVGIALMVAGLATLAGQHLPAPRLGRRPTARSRPAGARRALAPMFSFGIGYGLASLGCTLPLFLSLVGATLSTDWTGSLIVFTAYAVGMTTVLGSLALCAALIRDGLARRLHRVVAHLHRLSGALLILAGTYQTYYWARLRLGPAATVADDPVVGPITRYTAHLEAIAQAHSLTLVLVPAALMILAVARSALRRGRRQLPAAPAQPAHPVGEPP